MYVLARFQLHILITFGVTALQSTTEQSICTASIGETNYRRVQKWL